MTPKNTIIALTIFATLTSAVLAQSLWVKARDTVTQPFRTAADVISGDKSLEDAAREYLTRPIAGVGLANELQAKAVDTVYDLGAKASGSLGPAAEKVYDAATVPGRLQHKLSEVFVRTATSAAEGKSPLDIVATPLAAAIRAAREQHLRAAKPIPSAVRIAMVSLHSEETLNRAKFVIGNPRAALPEAINTVEEWFSDGHAVAVDDIIIFSKDPGMNLTWWAHELEHVAQYSRYGVEEFARRYMLGWKSIEAEADRVAAMVAPTHAAPVAAASTPIAIRVYGHVQGAGDVGPLGPSTWVGQKGRGSRLEFVRIECSLPGLQVQVMAHVEGQGDTLWTDGAQGVGTRGESRRIEGLAFRLVGPAAAAYSIVYRGHFEAIGDSRDFKDGEFCGTRGQHRRLEAVVVTIVRR